MMDTAPAPTFALVIAFLCWAATGVWVAMRGWRVQDRYLRAAGAAPVGRLSCVWLVLLVGAAALVAGHREAGAAAIVVLAMAGSLSMLVDAHTHRLPDTLTAVMALGAAIGVACAVAADGWDVLVGVGLGALVWTAPLALGYLARAGVGWGDVKIAPVLGATCGLLGWEAAAGGLIMAFLAAGAVAVWMLVRRRATWRTRIAMGPFLIGGALAAWVVWAVPIPGV